MTRCPNKVPAFLNWTSSGSEKTDSKAVVSQSPILLVPCASAARPIGTLPTTWAVRSGSINDQHVALRNEQHAMHHREHDHPTPEILLAAFPRQNSHDKTDNYHESHSVRSRPLKFRYR